MDCVCIMRNVMDHVHVHVADGGEQSTRKN